MSHTVTGKLNKDANEYTNQSGVTFFIRIGKQEYNFKTKEKVWSNFEAACFVKESQVQFYRDRLKAGAIVSVSGSGIISEIDEYNGKQSVKMHLQDAKIEYVDFPVIPNPQGQHAQQPPQAPQQGYQQPRQQPPAQHGGYADKFNDPNGPPF